VDEDEADVVNLPSEILLSLSFIDVYIRFL
jgi:hypothetical protein